MHKLLELKSLLKDKEKEISQNNFTILFDEQINGRKLTVILTQRFYLKTKKARIWLSNQFLTALKNYKYGYDETNARSTSGRDGIFLVDRDFKPKNEMIKKIYDRFLDKGDNKADMIVKYLGVSKSDLYGVRIVSHHLRLLGVLSRNIQNDTIVLIDYDNSK